MPPELQPAKIPVHLRRMPMPIDPNTPPIDILRMALEREKAAHAFYVEAAAAAQHPATKQTLLEMASECSAPDFLDTA